MLNVLRADNWTFQIAPPTVRRRKNSPSRRLGPDARFKLGAGRPHDFADGKKSGEKFIRVRQPAAEIQRIGTGINDARQIGRP